MCYVQLWENGVETFCNSQDSTRIPQGRYVEGDVRAVNDHDDKVPMMTAQLCLMNLTDLLGLKKRVMTIIFIVL